MKSINKLNHSWETVNIEYKSAKGGFPNSFWETFSAFANTNGGTIILGVKEKKRKFVPDGLSLEQVERYKKKFWDDAHNKTCVSVPLLMEDDVEIFKLEEGGYILHFHIPRAAYNLRPVYITLNPFGHTYIRNHEGDYLCTDDQVRQMFSDANHLRTSADSRILKNYTIDDIDSLTLRQYRRVFDKIHENHPWNGLPDDVFLENIGAYRKDRMSSEEGFTVAGILMFGKTSCITDQSCLPWFFPDYREHLSENPAERWSDRLYPDGTWEANLYQFYLKVLPRIAQLLPVPFLLAEDGITRVEQTTAHTALREALANACIHASYTQIGNITIDRYVDSVVISNPGTMLVSLEEYFDGHSSICRNPLLQKMFVFIGIGEKAGSGADTILKGWRDNNWIDPIVFTNFNPDSTEITLSVEKLTETSDKQAINRVASDKRAINRGGNEQQAINLSPNGKTSDKQAIKSSSTLKTSDKFSQILDFIRKKGEINTDAIAKHIGLSLPRTGHYLRILAAEGKVKALGANKKRTYILSDV